MQIVLGAPGVDGLSAIVGVLRTWQHDGAPIQLHPGDLGWFWRSGAEATAAAVRTWSHDGHFLALGLLDGPTLLRLAVAPDAQRSEELAQQLVADVTRPDRGVLPPGTVAVESPPGALVDDLLGEDGWSADEPWTLLRRDLSQPVDEPGLRIVVVGTEQTPVWSAVQRSAFGGSMLTDEAARTRWDALAAGLPFADARCLVGYDDEDTAVAVVTVWSAGPGRYGVIEPMGTHPEHRGRGHGTARRSASPPWRRSGTLVRRRQWWPPRAPTSAQWPPTSRPASSGSRSDVTAGGTCGRSRAPGGPSRAPCRRTGRSGPGTRR